MALSKDSQQPMTPHNHFSIDQIEEKFMSSLLRNGELSNFFSQLMSKRSDSARIKHVYQHLLRLQMMPKKPQDTKCDYLSTKSKNDGNKCFINQNYMEALSFYNVAVVFAKSPEIISVAFGNRSAALYRLKKYRESLLDIGRAINAGYSERLMPKLLLRKTQCEEAIKLIHVTKAAAESKVEEMRNIVLQPPEKRMAGVPCASASLEIAYSVSMGRSVMATEDILPGQVLVVEDPYVSILKNKNSIDRCYFCYSVNYAMIACEICTHAMYCNKECQIKSWNLGHKFECNIMSCLDHSKFFDVHLKSVRILLHARCQYSSWEEMFKMIELVEKETDPKLKGFTRNFGDVTYDIKNYAPIHMLETNMEKYDEKFTFSRCFISAVLLYMLKEYTHFFKDCPNILKDDYMWRAGSLLSRHSMILMTNPFSICAYKENVFNSVVELDYFATGIYAFSSLFNHSCAPNSRYIFRGTTIIILAQRLIKKGQQICITYGPEYHHTDFSSRHFELEHKYIFKCTCEACTNYWPLHIDLKRNNFISKKKNKQFRHLFGRDSVENLLERNDRRFNLNFIKQVYKCITVLDKYVPCIELVMCQDFILDFWRLLEM